jgi:hypothetical protein
MSFVPKDIANLSTVLSNTLDLASFIVSSIFSNVAPEIDAFMQFGVSTLYDFMKIVTIFLPSCFFFMSRAVTLYMATLTTMLAQYIIFTVLGYVSLFIAVITSVY